MLGTWIDARAPSCMPWWWCARGADDWDGHVELQHSEVRPGEIVHARDRALSTIAEHHTSAPCGLPITGCALNRSSANAEIVV